MKNLSLEEGEVAVLHELLKGDQARLFLEIAHTDTREYKDYLKLRENTLQSIMTKLG